MVFFQHVHQLMMHVLVVCRAVQLAPEKVETGLVLALLVVPILQRGKWDMTVSIEANPARNLLCHAVDCDTLDIPKTPRPLKHHPCK
jgi:hypothetical protein